MFKLFNKKNNHKVTYKIAFCDTPDISTKFGEYYYTFETREDAWHKMTSFTYGWGNAIGKAGRLGITNQFAKVDDSWLVIEEIKA